MILEYSEKSLGALLHDTPKDIQDEYYSSIYYHLGHVVRWMDDAAKGFDLKYFDNAD